MGRNGIQYSQVAAAANALVGLGQQPTVAKVRAFLGEGSNTTVDRFLKEWKAGRNSINSNEGREGAPDLESDLMDLVHQLFGRLSTRAQIDLDSYRIETAQKLSDAASETQAAQRSLRETAALLESTGSELAHVRAAMAHADTLARDRLAEIDSLHATAEATQQTLADRAAQIIDLRKQVDAARTQFDHYCEESNHRTMQERAQHEQEKGILRQETAKERTDHGNTRAELQQEKAKLEEGRDQRIRLESLLEQERTDHASARDHLQSARATESTLRSSIAAAQAVVEQLQFNLVEKRSAEAQHAQDIAAATQRADDALRELVTAKSVEATALANLVAAERRINELQELLRHAAHVSGRDDSARAD